jgi:hypothetical protein
MSDSERRPDEDKHDARDTFEKGGRQLEPDRVIPPRDQAAPPDPPPPPPPDQGD